MAEKLSKIPNQNNINSVILSQIENINDVIDVVVKAATKGTIKYSVEIVNQLNTYSNVITSLFSKDGAIISILKASESFSKINTTKINKTNINLGFKTLKLMQNHIKDFISNLSDIKELPDIKFDGVTDLIESINKLKGLLGDTGKSRTPIWFKFWIFKQEFKRIIKLIEDISKLSNIEAIGNEVSSVKLLATNIKNIFTDISEVFESLDSMKLKNLKIYLIKLNFIKNIFKNAINLFKLYNVKDINKLNKIFGSDGVSSIFTNITLIVDEISKSIMSLKKISIFKKVINNGIAALVEIIIKIKDSFNNVKINKSILKSIDQISDIINAIVIISKKIIILGLLALPILMSSMLVRFLLIPAIKLTITSVLILSELIILVKPDIDKGIKNISSIIVSLLIIGAAFIGFALLTPLFLKSISWGVLTFILAAMLLSLAIWGAFKLIGKLSISSIPNILAFGLTVGILVTTLIASAMIILVASKVSEQLAESVGKIAKMILGMLALTAVMVLLGMGIAALSPFIISSMVGFGQILGIVVLIISIGLTINYLATFTIKSEEAKNKTNKIISTVNLIREELINFGTKKEWKQDKKVLKQVNKTVKVITKIADNINKLQLITIDKDKIITNVTNILGFTQTLQDLMNKLLFGGTINDKNDINNGNWITRNLGSLFHKGASKRMRKEMNQNKRVLSKVDKVIDKLVGIGDALVSIGEIKMTPEFTKNITDNIQAIFAFISSLDTKINEFMNVDEVSNEDIIDAKKMSKKEWRQNKKTLSKVEATIATIQGIGETINLLKDFKFTAGPNGTKEVIIKNVSILMDTIKDVAGTITGKNNDIKINPNDIAKLQPLIDYINSLNNGFKNLASNNENIVKNNIDNYIRLLDRISLIDKSAFNDVANGINDVNSSFDKVNLVNEKRFASNIDSYIKFVDKINTVEVNKLEKSAQMFQQMASFSNSIKGNFEKLAESINEDLMPVLEELKEIMEKVPTAIETNGANVSASIGAATASPTRENITAQVARENPGLKAEEVNKIVTDRLNEKAQADANSVTTKLDELISLLKGYTGETVIVQTV